MIVNYKGFEINVFREKCMAGYDLTYYSIFRLDDEREIDSGFYYEGGVRETIKNFKKNIDANYDYYIGDGYG